MKSKVIHTIENQPGKFIFFCPGCQHCHFFQTQPNGVCSATWTFNGDFESPTVSPSILVNQDDSASRCHLFVENGHLKYLDDCHHGLKGKIVPMEKF